jgi:hypothetical protein
LWFWARSPRRVIYQEYEAPTYSTDDRYIVRQTPIEQKSVIKQETIYINPIESKIPRGRTKTFIPEDPNSKIKRRDLIVKKIAPLSETKLFKSDTPHHTLTTKSFTGMAFSTKNLGSNKSFTQAVMKEVRK